MPKKIRDEDFEVVEEVIEDYDYFYEDEEEVVRNVKFKRKLKITSILIAVFAVFLIILFTGIAQMKIYNTNKTVNKERILYVEYMNTIENNKIISYLRDGKPTYMSDGYTIDWTGSWLEKTNEFYVSEASGAKDILDEEEFESIEAQITKVYESIGKDSKGNYVIKMPSENSSNEAMKQIVIFNEQILDTYNLLETMVAGIKKEKKMPNANVTKALLDNISNLLTLYNEVKEG